jgi:hypothetical protein
VSVALRIGAPIRAEGHRGLVVVSFTTTRVWARSPSLDRAMGQRLPPLDFPRDRVELDEENHGE